MMNAWMTKRPWREVVAIHEKLYNATPHKTTMVSPAQEMLNRKLQIGLPFNENNLYAKVDWDAVRERDEKAKQYMKKYGDTYVKARKSNIEEGDLVYVLTSKKNLKLQPVYLLDNSRKPRKFRVAKFDEKSHKVSLIDDILGGTLERDVANVFKCPKNSSEELHDEILSDITSDRPSRMEVAEIPVELIRTLDNNSSDNNQDLRDAVDQAIEHHVELEIKRPKRVAAEKALEKK